jgi:hypothetical protein
MSKPILPIAELPTPFSVHERDIAREFVAALHSSALVVSDSTLSNKRGQSVYVFGEHLAKAIEEEARRVGRLIEIAPPKGEG